MNILRWKRKSKKKIKLKTIILVIFSLVMTTFAWFAYSKILNTSLKMHVAAWDMEYYIGTSKQTNPIGIEIPVLYPTMEEITETIKIKNNGEKMADIEYTVNSISIAGTIYEVVKEGNTNTSSNYIIITPPAYETNEDGVELAKGAIINDLSKFPFQILVEYSTEIASEGQGYLKVTANWLGDQAELDSEWGYIVGEYFANNPSASSAMTINITIEAYQSDPDNENARTNILPSTAETNPYLPTGFTRIPGTSLETGLVIKDSSGNEYVWVEVPKSETVYGSDGLGITEFTDTNYAIIENKLKNYTSTYHTVDDAYTSYDVSGITSEDMYTLYKQKMLKSIYENGGFYIGRYETGIMEKARTTFSAYKTPTETPVIKANAYPFNFLNGKQAQTIAESMESAEYTTSLMFGLQWDLVLKYMETKGVSINELKTDSTSWGNYANNEFDVISPLAKYYIIGTPWAEAPYIKENGTQLILTTGANNTLFKQNIYDFAGNLAEWTLSFRLSDGEYVGGNGGEFTLEGTYSANYKASYNGTLGYRNVGFRVTIY